MKGVTGQIAALYLGHPALNYTSEGMALGCWDISTLTLVNMGYDLVIVKPILRPLSSLTEGEAQELFKMSTGIDWYQGSCLEKWWDNVSQEVCPTRLHEIGNPSVWLYLLEKGFDLFELIGNNLAVVKDPSHDA